MHHEKGIFASALCVALVAAWFTGEFSESASQLDAPFSVEGQTSSRSNSPSSRSGMTTVKIVAEIESIKDPMKVLTDIHVGDTIDGSYTFDHGASDRAADPTSGNFRFFSPPSGVILHVGSHRFTTDANSVDFEINIETLASGNQFSFVSHNNIARPEFAQNGSKTKVDRIWWCLHDFTGNALASDQIPTGALDLSNWQSLVGLRIEGRVVDVKSKSESPLLIVAKVTRTETVAR